MEQNENANSHSLVWKGKKLYSGEQFIGSLMTQVGMEVECREEIRSNDAGYFDWTLKLKSKVVEPIIAQTITLGFETNYPTTYAMIPSVLYNGNDWGKGQEPKGFIKNGSPWSFAYHRTAVAGATYSEGAEWAVGLFGLFTGTGFSCSLVPDIQSTCHSLIWPLEEMPYSYTGRDRYSDGYREEWVMEPEKEYELKAVLVIRPVHATGASWRTMLDTAWSLNTNQQSPRYSSKQLWQLGIRYVKESLYTQEDFFTGTSIGLHWSEDAWRPRPTWKYKAGWTGQNISLAVSLLADYSLNGDSESLEMGLKTLDCWSKHAKLTNGLIRCHFDYLLPSSVPNQREVQDAVHLSDAAMNFFEAFEITRKLGVDRPSYLDMALGVCDFVVRQQNEDGRLGKSWNNDGSVDDPEGTIGSALVVPLMKAYNITGEHVYLGTAEKAYRYYMDELLVKGFTTAGALDTYCIDKESAIPCWRGDLSSSRRHAMFSIWSGPSMPLGIWQHGNGTIQSIIRKEVHCNSSVTIHLVGLRCLPNIIITIRMGLNS